MSAAAGPDIIQDGLVLCLDAGNRASYSSVGTAWNDLTKPDVSLSVVEALIVGGGGAGGGGIGGGGGGGGVIHMPAALITPGAAYTITVGAGGASVSYPNRSLNGENSSAFGATAAGGGGSGVHDSGIGYAGGSGGGAASNNGALNQGGASSGNSLGSNSGTIYGNRGGNMLNSRNTTPTAAAGGGGAGAAAADVNSNIVLSSPGTAQGKGGDGIPNSILGTLYYWGGGGGGGAYYNGYAGNGGLGGGGGGSCTAGVGPTTGGGSALNSGNGAAINTNGGSGGANTGGGGGGGAWQYTSGGAGGSGIVVIRYAGPQKATGGTITSVGGDTVHTFTTSGTFTLNQLPGIEVLTNGVGFNAANGGSLIFDGSDDYVNCGNPSMSVGKITVNAWVKLTAGSVFQHIVDSASNTWHLAFLSDNRPYFYNGVANSYSAPILSIGVWYMLTGIQGTTLDIYINGILGSSIASNTNITTNNINIGRWQAGGGRQFNGNISQVSIYNRALSPTEIQQNYNATKGRFLL